MIYSQKLESPLSRIFIGGPNLGKILHFCLTPALPEISHIPQQIFSGSPEQMLLICKNLIYFKNKAEATALSNFFLYGHLQGSAPCVSQIKIINMLRENSSTFSRDIGILTQVIRPSNYYYRLSQTEFQRVILYSSLGILTGICLITLLWLFRNGYLTKKQFYLFLSKIINRTISFFKYLYLFLSKLLNRFKIVKQKIGTLPEKIISKTMDSSLPLPIDVLKEVEEFLHDVNSREQCHRFILEMMRFGETGVVQVSQYKVSLKNLRNLGKILREYEADGKTHLIPEILEKILFSKKTLTNLGLSIQRIARVFLRKTRYYSVCLDKHESLEALDDALFDRIQEIFEIFIAFGNKYGIELNE